MFSGCEAAERPRAPKPQRTASVPEPTCHEFESRSSSQTFLGIPMPRFSKRAISSRRNGAKSKAVLALTEEQHTFFESAPALTLSAPERFWVERGSSARKMHLLAHTSWQYVVAHFDSVPLEDKSGNLHEPTEDYGGLRAMMTIIPKEEAGQPTGFKFMGTPSYDKRGKSKQHEAVTHKPYRKLLQAVFDSLVETPEMVLIDPRAGFFNCVDTGWHTDANTRGSHPNAVRLLDAGGFIRIYQGVNFRCSLINFKGQVVLPLDLNMVYFRYIIADEHGGAAMVEVSATDFWELVVKLGPSVVGHTGACIVNIKEGQLLTCPMDYRDVRSGRPGSELDSFSFEELYQRALACPWTPPCEPFQIIGEDLSRWHVFFGWKNPHRWEGSPMVRRVHVIGCPYRQNGTGQNRSVAGKVERPPKPIPPARAAILNLKPGDWIEIYPGHWSKEALVQVIEVQDALHLCDMRVKVREGEFVDDGNSEFMCLSLGLIPWSVYPSVQ